MISYLKKMAQDAQLTWPYEVDYEKETRVSCDVLVVGGGIGGCFAAIHAARRGAKVAVIEKGNTKRSGAAGAGIDHWHEAFTNPCSKMSPEEMMEYKEEEGPYEILHNAYIAMKESYDAALDLEELGIDIRDSKGEFEGAPFRDPETKLMFAYDYGSRDAMRIHGRNLKPALQKEMKRLGIAIYDRCMATALLTEGGKQGGAVIGATAFHQRTGEFYVFHSKATILATAKPLRIWEFATDLVGSNAAHDDPNCAGDGDVMAWRAGATMMMMENTNASSGGKRYPAYGAGNTHNTWYPCSIVDAVGNEVPWMDKNGRILETPEERSKTVPGQKFFFVGPTGGECPHQSPTPVPDLGDRILAGEFKLPFFADLSALPEYERRAIFGLMIGNEGKTYVPVLKKLQDAGFDPEHDMLQANVLPPQLAGSFQPWWDVKSPGLSGVNVLETSFMNYGGLVVDWDMKSSLDGLYAVGSQVAGSGGAAVAAATGRYCGRIVANLVKDKELVDYEEEQVQAERKRIYRSVHHEGRSYGWKEIQLGLCRMMQDYCGAAKSKEVLEMGLWWLDSIRGHELAKAKANNPHEMGKVLECDVRLAVGEMIMLQSLMREESCPQLGFERMDFPQSGNSGGNFITIRQENGQPTRGEIPFGYWLKGDNEDSYLENYKKHCSLKEGER